MNGVLKSHLKRLWWSFVFALFVVAIIIIATDGEFLTNNNDKTPEEIISDINTRFNKEDK
jgi:hypothetical protein